MGCQCVESGLTFAAYISESVQGEPAAAEARGAASPTHNRKAYKPAVRASSPATRKQQVTHVQQNSTHSSPRTATVSDVSGDLSCTPAGTPAPHTPALEQPGGSGEASEVAIDVTWGCTEAAAVSPVADEATAEDTADLGSDVGQPGEAVRVLSPLSASQRWLPQPPVAEHLARCINAGQRRAKAQSRSSAGIPRKPASQPKPRRAPSAGQAQTPQTPPRSRLPARSAHAQGGGGRGMDSGRSTTVTVARKARQHAAQSFTARGAAQQQTNRQPPTPTHRLPQPASASAVLVPRPPDAGACRRDRRVTLEQLFHSHGTCTGSTRCHVRAVLTCLPPGVRKSVLAWSEICGRAETNRGRYARTVVREMKRLLHTLCGVEGRPSAAGTAALGAALRDLVGVSPWADLHPKPRCPRAADTYGLLMSSFSAAMSQRATGRVAEVMEVEAAPVGEDSDQMHMAEKLAAVLDGRRPVAAVCQPQDVEELRHVSGSHVLAVERRGERRFAVACMLLMRVAVGSLRAAPHGGGFAEVLAHRLQACLCGGGGGGAAAGAAARPALIQVPATVTVEFDWSSSTNVGLLLPHAEFLPHFFAKGCRFDLQDVAATQSGESLPYQSRCNPSPLPLPRQFHVHRHTAAAQHARVPHAQGCDPTTRIIQVINLKGNTACFSRGLLGERRPAQCQRIMPQHAVATCAADARLMHVRSACGACAPHAVSTAHLELG